MQTETSPAYRYRGYRESRPLVTLPREAAADLTRAQVRDLANRAEYDAREADLATLCETRAAEIGHYRAQLRFRLSGRG